MQHLLWNLLFLRLFSIEEEDKCLICNKNFRRNDKIQYFGVNSWPKFQEQAEKWSKLKIHKNNDEYVYALVHNKLNGTEKPFGKSHGRCKRDSDLRHINSATKFGVKNPTETDKLLSVIFLGCLL